MILILWVGGHYYKSWIRSKTIHSQYEAPITWDGNYLIDCNGIQEKSSSTLFSSLPIPVFKGDVIHFDGYLVGNKSAVSKVTDIEKRKYIPLVIPSKTGVQAVECTIDEDGWIIVSAKTVSLPLNGKSKLTIERNYSLSKLDGKQEQVPLKWWNNVRVNSYGHMENTDSEHYLSEPIHVWKGDLLRFRGFCEKGCAVISKSHDLINTYQGTTYPPLVIGEKDGMQNILYRVQETGYIVLSAKVDGVAQNNENELTIFRTEQIQNANNTKDTILKNEETTLKENYVDKLDFVPNTASKRNNSILTYAVDDKKTDNYMVNAVAYPNGEIIACRAGGCVVKISNEGKETCLLNVPNAQDWRGMYMDKDLNVYVSPHSSTFTPGVNQMDRGLYRLAYGETEFKKVLPLYYPDYNIPQWKKGTTYSKNQIVFYLSSFYKCKGDHNSDEEFDINHWDEIEDWKKQKEYSIGNMVKYHSNYYVCSSAHVSAENFQNDYWIPATACMKNDDTIWTMCEDNKGNLYAGVYAHSVRRNPAVYISTDGGETWVYQFNFINNGTLPLDNYGDLPRHVHCINFNDYDNCLYAAVGEVNTIVKSSDYGKTWTDLHTPCYYGQPTYVLGTKDGLVIGSDGHYSCGVSKLLPDGKTMKKCGRTAPGFIFNIRRSDVTGWLYAFTRIDNYVGAEEKCPPLKAINDTSILENWKKNKGSKYIVKLWNDYHSWAQNYYPEDAVRPQNAVIMVSKDDGDTWEVIRSEHVCDNSASICGFITVGYFRDGECLAGLLKSVKGTADEKSFVKPIVITEGKKKRTKDGFDLTGEIFIKTNQESIVGWP